ncbi:MAG: hypothetical protein IKA10_09380 [Oscillospiraceae bacterium]|nr:hypothetical protein [Oscillospiraceae bacterium]
MSNTELNIKLRELKELKIMQDELQNEIDSLQDEIKSYMTAAQIDTLNVDVFKVTYKEVTSSRFDSVAFKKTHSELYNQYLKQTVTKRFVLA